MAESDTGNPSTSRISIMPPPIEAPRIAIVRVGPVSVIATLFGCASGPMFLGLSA